MATNDLRPIQRDVLPVPDLPRSGLVTYDAAADADHRLDPDELLRVAMARQLGPQVACPPAQTPAGTVARRTTPREARHEATRRPRQ